MRLAQHSDVHVLALLVLGCIIDGYRNPCLNALHCACMIHYACTIHYMSSMHIENRPDIFLQYT